MWPRSTRISADRGRKHDTWLLVCSTAMDHVPLGKPADPGWGAYDAWGRGVGQLERGYFVQPTFFLG